MPFSSESGYTPTSIETIMLSVMNNVNAQFGTTYTQETFLGSGFYKYAYALVQLLQENEVKTSEIFLKIQDYFAITNERISRPVVTNPGLIEKLETEGYVASIKKPIDADAGKLFVCVDVDDGDNASGIVTITSYANLVAVTGDTITVGATVFTAQAGSATPGDATFQAATSNNATAISLAAQINAHATAGALVGAVAVGAVVTLTALDGGTAGNSIALAYADLGTATIGATVSGANLTGGTANADYDDIKLDICTIIKESTVAGIVTQGTEVETIVIPNGQSFDFKFNLPVLIPVLLRLTINLSENNQNVISSPEEIKELLMSNIASKYKLGKNFEPQKYFSIVDAPWAESVLLEWSDDDGDNYYSTVFDADYDDLFVVLLENIELIEA